MIKINSVYHEPFTIHHAFTMSRLPWKAENRKRTENGKPKTVNGTPAEAGVR